MALTDAQIIHVRYMRAQGWTIFRLAQAFHVSLSEIRRALDQRAADLHVKWAR